jgi:hypothetical protein
MICSCRTPPPFGLSAVAVPVVQAAAKGPCGGGGRSPWGSLACLRLRVLHGLPPARGHHGAGSALLLRVGHTQRRAAGGDRASRGHTGCLGGHMSLPHVQECSLHGGDNKTRGPACCCTYAMVVCVHPWSSIDQRARCGCAWKGSRHPPWVAPTRQCSFTKYSTSSTHKQNTTTK